MLFCAVTSAQQPENNIIQGSPFIQNFTFPERSFSSGKISVFESPDGGFVLGGRNKIILFYGNEFISMPLNGQINVIGDDKTSFYTGFNTVGVIRIFKNSLPKLIPLVDDKKNHKNRFGQINKVFINDNVLVFNNRKYLYQSVDGSNIQIIDSSKVELRLFKVNNALLVTKYEKGICQFTQGIIDNIPGGELFKNKDIECILSFCGALLVKIKGEKDFCVLKNGQVAPVQFGFEDFVQKNGFSDAVILPSGDIAIATKSSGLLIFNKKTKSIVKISVEDGLPENSLINLYVDKTGNLWLMHNKGISRIELNIPVSAYGFNAGLSGNVNDILKFKNRLYVATQTGLYYAGFSGNNNKKHFDNIRFKHIEDISGEVNCLFVEKGNLLFTTPNGIFKLNDDKVKTIFFDEIKSFERIQFQNESFFCIAKESSLDVFKYQNEQIDTVVIINMADNPPSLVNEDNGIVWVKTENNDLLYLEKDKLGSIVSASDFVQIKTFSGNNFGVIKTESGLRFTLAEKVFRYDKFRKIFVEEKITLFGVEEIPRPVKMITDVHNNQWYNLSGSLQGLKGILLYQKIGRDSVNTVFFNTGLDVNKIFVDTTSVWIAASDKLLRYDLQRNYKPQRQFSAIIKRVIIGQDSILPVELEDPEIKYSLSNVRFIVSSTCFEGEPYIRYQHRILGKSKEWSAWDSKSIITSGKLSPGDYTFQVRAISIEGRVSEITELHFTVLSPFYKTIPAYVVYVVLLMFLIFVALRYKTWRFIKYKEGIERIVQERTKDILKEKEKSEILIANLLPKGTADELKQTGKATSQKFNMVTVLFSDIQGFTKIAEQMNPDVLIDQLDAFFFHFDSVVEKYNIEKIKTIGDAYMCAGGIPDKNITNPVEVVLAALEMQEYMAGLKKNNSDIWDLRIGIHTGSVIAGVVGHKKLSYDIWGDTVNTASRMESSGEAGKVNISGQTYELVKDFFICEYRGKMPVKYKGEIDMYFVKSIRPELSIDMHIQPNKKFFIMLQLLRLQDVQDEVIEKLINGLPKNLYFHNVERVKELFNLVDLYSRAEEMSDEDKLVVKTAALLADVGYIQSYDEHEEYSIEFAKDFLPRFKYNQEQIEKICALIDITKQNRKPQNKLEEILLDAEMNYLSRADFVSLNEQLFKEQLEHGKIESKEDWVKMQVVLLSNHKYYTQVANVLRDVNPDSQIENLLQNLQKNT
ncbi:MAG TPA: adenylate/guanylate cyclase domain-containing protein [Bacteroidales bacterium]|nr:adenylate/guanylate cyclase domain-containing protein [Bacteroidales bacterium]